MPRYDDMAGELCTCQCVVRIFCTSGHSVDHARFLLPTMALTYPDSAYALSICWPVSVDALKLRIIKEIVFL